MFSSFYSKKEKNAMDCLNFNGIILTLVCFTLSGNYPETVRRILYSTGMKPWRPNQAIPLTPRHKAARLRWERRHFRYNQRQLGKVLFSDESIFDRNVNANTYFQNVLQPVVVPFMRQHFRVRGEFQQNNAPAHRARLTTDFLLRNNINVMNWPAKSPDM